MYDTARYAVLILNRPSPKVIGLFSFQCLSCFYSEHATTIRRRIRAIQILDENLYDKVLTRATRVQV